MNKEEILNKTNNSLKVYLNEAKFISNKCRNRIIKLLGEEFNIDIDKNSYVEFQNVDIVINEDFDIVLRGEVFKTNIDNIDSFNTTFNSYKEKVEDILNKKEINFETKNDFNNIINLIMIVLLLFIVVIITYIAIKSIFSGNLQFGLWFVIFVLPYVVPNLKDNLKSRFESARIFLKRLIKRHK